MEKVGIKKGDTLLQVKGSFPRIVASLVAQQTDLSTSVVRRKVKVAQQQEANISLLLRTLWGGSNPFVQAEGTMYCVVLLVVLCFG